MSYTAFKTASWISHPAESLRKTLLLLSVRPLDTFTNAPADVPMTVSLKEFPQARVVRTQAGFFCFEGRLYQDENGVEEEVLFRAQPGVDYTLIAEPDRVVADWFYQKPRANEDWSSEFVRKVRLVGRPLPPPPPGAALPDPAQWEPIDWVPNSSYPFPANTTLLRGIVKDKAAPNAPLANVVVRAIYDRFRKAEGRPPQVESVTVETLSNKQGEFALFFKALPANKPPQKPTTQVIEVGPVIQKKFQQQSVTIEEGRTTKTIIDATLP